jgi:hemerythrin
MGLHVYWTRGLATDIPLLDEQHQELFSRVNQLVDVCQNGFCHDQSRDYLIYLRRYVEVHFAAEEALMGLHHYPQRLRHQREHQGFVAELAELTVLLERPPETWLDRDQLLSRINETIVDWLFEHVCMEYRDLARHLNPQQVPRSIKIHQPVGHP